MLNLKFATPVVKNTNAAEKESLIMTEIFVYI